MSFGVSMILCAAGAAVSIITVYAAIRTKNKKWLIASAIAAMLSMSCLIYGLITLLMEGGIA